jgi:hypothetical protein
MSRRYQDKSRVGGQDIGLREQGTPSRAAEPPNRGPAQPSRHVSGTSVLRKSRLNLPCPSVLRRCASCARSVAGVNTLDDHNRFASSREKASSPADGALQTVRLAYGSIPTRPAADRPPRKRKVPDKASTLQKARFNKAVGTRHIPNQHSKPRPRRQLEPAGDRRLGPAIVKRTPTAR